MITGKFHEGSGLGNQIQRYVAVRVLALDKGYDFSMMGDFKGDSFMRIDKGLPTNQYSQYFEEKKVEHEGVDIRPYDPEINFVEDYTWIDGEFQDERYFEHRLPEIREWLKVEPLSMSENVCVINFRGGEYVGVPDLFLGQEYWHEAIAEIKKINPDMKFWVHTDDPETARQFFPDYEIVHNVGLNWRAIRYARYLILSNSSFAIMPALLNENAKKIIAPRYWARHNTQVWTLPQNYYKKFTYI